MYYILMIRAILMVGPELFISLCNQRTHFFFFPQFLLYLWSVLAGYRR